LPAPAMLRIALWGAGNVSYLERYVPFALNLVGILINKKILDRRYKNRYGQIIGEKKWQDLLEQLKIMKNT
jgi:hypothetical protein